MKVLDPGHDYELDVLDGDFKIQLTFVKRVGDKYPGNTTDFPGTNMQEVMRALIDRCYYLNNQIYSPDTSEVIRLLRRAIYHLEHRAADIHGRKMPGTYMQIVGGIESLPKCSKCGHIGCKGECHHAGSL